MLNQLHQLLGMKMKIVVAAVAVAKIIITLFLTYGVTDL
jgi:hypothetical protein